MRYIRAIHFRFIAELARVILWPVCEHVVASVGGMKLFHIHNFQGAGQIVFELRVLL